MSAVHGVMVLTDNPPGRTKKQTERTSPAGSCPRGKGADWRFGVGFKDRVPRSYPGAMVLIQCKGLYLPLGAIQDCSADQWSVGMGSLRFGYGWGGEGTELFLQAL